MVTSPGLLGTVDEKNIVIGACRCFVAPYSTYVDEWVRFDCVNPPAPFLDLGSCKPDAALSVTQQYYKFQVGVPKVTKDKKKIAVDCMVTISLDEFSGSNLARAVWNTNNALKNFYTAPAVVVASAIPAGNIVQLPDATGFIEKQYVAIASSPSGLVNTSDEYKIVEISGNYLLLDRDIITVFSAAPYVGMIKSWRVPFSGSKSCRIAFVMVYDDSENGQMVVALPCAVIDGNFSTGISGQTNTMIQIVINGEAFVDSDIADNAIAVVLKFK